ncbi:MAG TPA: alpha/beta hydrolase fold domain-containing protein [Opitutaceae bacterium]|nr:alpha/beta hydrolase fold domain-containing protein [Opitutaceae bacterium]
MRFLSFLGVLVWVAASAAPGEPVHIVLVGDSTVTDHSGWGLGFRHYAGPELKVTNMAMGGRSSKSYRDEGHWDKALALDGDYYIIQFGHNDQPGKGPERETDPATTFPENVTRYVDEVRERGKIPVLVTSLVRRKFSAADPARLDDTLAPWADAVRRVAADKGVALVDLHRRSREHCESIGPGETAKFNFPDGAGKTDLTHLDPRGSAVFARLVREELDAATPLLGRLLRKEPGPAFLADVSYGTAAGEKLPLDVSVPAGDGPFPIAILVHGGGWGSGDKANVGSAGGGADISPWFQPLTDAKFVWFSLNYRLAPRHRWPACLEDVTAAIRWVKAQAARYSGDPARIALFGHSAGGHLACLAGTLADDSVRVQAVVGCAPVTNHEQDLAARGGLSQALQHLLDRPKEVTAESRGLLRAISPINHARPGLPPFLLLHGDADRTVPLQQSLDFQAKLREHGVRCDLVVLPGAPHRLLDWERHAPDHDERMIAWLREVL